MERDLNLLKSSAQDNIYFLRFYYWEKPTLSAGVFQKKEKIDFDFLKKNDIEFITRPTGGRAVLHEKELTYSFCAPSDSDLGKLSVSDSYLEISRALSKGLIRFGIPVEVSRGKRKEILNSEGTRLRQSSVLRVIPGSAACFDTVSDYEITLNGKKLVGSAQTRKKGGILQHGSILFSLDFEKYANCFALSQEKKETLAKFLKKNVATLSEAKITLPVTEDLKENLKSAFEDYFAINFKRN